MAKSINEQLTALWREYAYWRRKGELKRAQEAAKEYQKAFNNYCKLGL